MFNEQNLQKQLQNFQLQSNVQVPQPLTPQQLQYQQQVHAQHYQQQVQVQQYQQQQGHQQWAPQLPQQFNQGNVAWQTQQPMQHFQNASSNQHQHFNKPQKQMSTSVTSKVQNQKLVQNKQRQIFLPTWLKESISPPKDLSASASSSLSAVREVYTRALGLVECTSSSAPEENKTPDGARSVEWVNTNRVSLLLLRTGVPAGVLAVLWELVNCTKTGQLTRDECAGLLALIALVQSGESLVSGEVLQGLPDPVVPLLDHPALLPHIQLFQQLQAQQHQLQQEQKQQFHQHVITQSQIQQPKPQQRSVINPPQTHRFNNNASINGTSVDDDEEFDDFVGASVPSCNNNIDTPFVSSLPQPALLPTPSVPTTSSASVLLPTDIKRMNLPQVGKSPDVSPSLSFDANSLDDEFDDFQSATSDPCGLLSGDGSPRSATNVPAELSCAGSPALKTSCIDGDQWKKKMQNRYQTNCFSNDKSTLNLSQHFPSKTDPAIDESVLIQNKINPSDDKYAAFRSLDFGGEDAFKSCIVPTTNENNTILNNTYSTLVVDGSFGDFCSVGNTQEDDDDFGDFATATTFPPASALPTYSGSQKSKPQLLPTQTSVACEPFGANFDADFSSLALNDNFCAAENSTRIANAKQSASKQTTSDESQSFSLFVSAISSNLNNNRDMDKVKEFTNFTSSEVNVNNTDDSSYINPLKLYEFSDPQNPLALNDSPALISSTKSDVSIHNNSVANPPPVGTGGGEWSDLFGVLRHDSSISTDITRNLVRSSSQLNPQNQPVPAATLTHDILPWSEEPPALQDTVSCEEADDFGDFLSPVAFPALPTGGGQSNSDVNNAASTAAGSDNDYSEFATSVEKLGDVDKYTFDACQSLTPTTVISSVFTPVFEPPAIELDDDDDDDSSTDITSITAQVATKAALTVDSPTDSSVSTNTGNSCSTTNVAAVLSAISEPLSLDKYSSIREKCSVSSSPEECWQRCLVSCSDLLTAAVVALQPLQTQEHLDTDTILATQHMDHYLNGVAEVVYVVARVRASLDSVRSAVPATLQLQQNLQTLHQLHLAIQHALGQESVFAERTKDLDVQIPTVGIGCTSNVDDDESSKVCAVCLTIITANSQPCTSTSTGSTTLHSTSATSTSSTSASGCSAPISMDGWRSSQSCCLEYGGHSYHASCANLWINCVDLTLPVLAPPRLL